MIRAPKIWLHRSIVWFENSRGIISIGNLLGGEVGSTTWNVIRCQRTGREFYDAPNWQTRQQYESLDARGKLGRNRHGSIHQPGR